MTLRDDGESVGLFEPLLVSEGAKSRSMLDGLALLLVDKSAAMSASLPSAISDSLADFVQVTECHYSNLIEGHVCHPSDIGRATRSAFSDDANTRDLQVEACAHIAAQKWIGQLGTAAAPFSVEFVLEVHKRLCELLPPSFLLMDTGEHNQWLSLEPGAIRTRDVQVGRHVAVSAGAVPRFLARMEQAYKLTGTTNRSLAAACGHHRLLWVHPFLDGNGRVARLVSHAVLATAIGTKCLWSLSRGLSRREKEYKALL